MSSAREPAVARVFDRLEHAFNSASHRRLLSTGLVVVFFLSLLLIFAVALTLAYNRFAPVLESDQPSV